MHLYDILLALAKFICFISLLIICVKGIENKHARTIVLMSTIHYCLYFAASALYLLISFMEDCCSAVAPLKHLSFAALIITIINVTISNTNFFKVLNDNQRQKNEKNTGNS